MSWPDINDYNEALQNLAATCGDPLLKQCEPVRNPLGLLLPYAGGFADVYAVKSPDGRKWAVKCFKKHRPELHERYELIDAHLKSVKLPFTVPFAYVPQGLRIRGDWYPIVRMEWVEGLRLNDFVAESFEKPQMLDQLAELWPKVAQRLQAANLAHADLQHGNVLLVPRGEDGSLSLKLIDYDGMYVPAFAGQRSGELGHGCFQHPQRLRDKLFNADVDRFSHLVIYTALRCLRVAGKDLWQRFENGDNLLFRESDFVSPAKSPLLGELWRINHPAAHAMTGRLVLATQQPLAAAPWLHEIVQGREVKPLTPQEEGRVREVLGQAAPAKTLASAETIETAAPGTRPGTQPTPLQTPPLPTPPTRATGTKPAPRPADPLNPLGKPQGDLLKPREPEEPPEAPLGPILWQLYRQNLLLANVGLVGALTLLLLVGAMLFSGGEGETDESADPLASTQSSGATPPAQPKPVFRQGRTLTSNDLPVASLAFGIDEPTLIAGRGDGTVAFWDVRTGQSRQTLEGVYTALSADKRKLAVYGAPLLRILDPANGALQQSIDVTVNGVVPPVRSLALRPDGGQVALAAGNAIQVWDVGAGVLLRTHTDLPGELYCVAYSPDGSRLAAAGDYEFVGLWDAQSGASLWTRQSDNAFNDVMCVAFSRDGRTLATNGPEANSNGIAFGSNVVLRSVATGETQHVLSGHASLVMTVEFSPDGRFLASGSDDQTIKLWNAATGELWQTLEPHSAYVRTLAISADSRVIAAGCYDGTIQLWTSAPLEAEQPSTAPAEYPPYQLARTLPGHAASINAAAVSPDGRLIATSSGDATIRLWDAATGAERQTLGSVFASDPVTAVAFSPDGRTLVGGRNGNLELWDPATGELRRTLFESSGFTTCLAFSPSGLLLAAQVGETAQVWHVPSGSLRYALTSQETAITAIAVSTDGQALLAGCRSGELIVFNLATGDSTLRIAPGLPGEVRALACLPQATVVAASTTDGQIYFWDFTTGSSLGALPTNLGGAEKLAYRSDGRVLASWLDTGVLKLWDTSNARLRQEIPLGVGNRAVAFSPDGLLLVTSDNNTNSVVVWALPAGAESAAQQPPATPPDEAMAEQSVPGDSETLVDPFGSDPDGAPAPDPRPTPSPDPGAGAPALPEFLAAEALERHPGYVFTLAFSPDRRRLASGGTDGTLMLWNAATGEFERQAGFHSGSIFAAAYSPNGTLLASSGDDPVIELWNTETFGSRELPRTHSARVLDLAFSPNGRWLASCSEDQLVCLWDLDSGEVSLTLSGHALPVRSVAFSPDGQTLASASADRTIKLWSTATGENLRTLEGHADECWTIAFSPDGQTLASASADQTIKLWDVATGQVRHTLQGHSGGVFAASYSPDGRLVASGSADGTVRLWNAATGELWQTLVGHQFGVYALAFSPDGATLASSGYETTVRLWRGAGSAATPATVPGSVPAPGPLPAGPLEFQQAQQFRVHTNAVRGLAFAEGGQTLVSGGADSKVNFLDPATGEVRASSGGQAPPVFALAASPDGLLLASGDDSGAISLWNPQGGGGAGALEEHTGTVWSVAFSPDGAFLASGGEDRSLIVWDLSERDPLFRAELHRGAVLSVAYSPDGVTLASGSEDHTINLWEAATGRALQSLTDHTDDVNCVAFSPDGQTLASCSKDRTIRLWDAATWTVRQTLTGHKAPVLVAAFSPDGRWLASGGGDDDVLIWDATTGELLQRLAGHKSTVFALAFTPDGRTLASGSLDRSIILWQWAPAAGAAAPEGATPAGAAAAAPQGRQKGLFDGRLGPVGAEEFQALTAAQLGLPTRVESAVGLPLQLIPAGRFQMGSPPSEADRHADEPQHDVTLTKPFYLGATEVTRGQFEQFFPAWESEQLGPLAGHENDAQTMVSWVDACAFCNALSAREGWPAYYAIEGPQATIVGGLGYRLPTEAEMEYVCRCGTTTPYYADHDFPALAAYRANASLPHAVALARPNAWGLYDLYGGVWEWCEDWYDAQYAAAAREDPRGPDVGDERVLRGGCSAANAEWMRCAARNKGGLTYARQNSIGFRVARTIYE